MRCSPPLAQHTALQDFDTKVRHCLAHLTGMHLSQVQWQQAARGFGQAGLGLRSAVLDAPAAYLASVGSCATRCSALDAGFDVRGLSSLDTVSQALQLLNTHLDQPIAADVALSKRQAELSRMVDASSWQRHLSAATPVARAMLLSESEPGAGAFLAAVPRGRCRMESAAFTAELRLRLAVPDTSEDVWCPRCDALLDAHSHHAGVCAAGGERTMRHNALRDAVSSWAERAGLQPEKGRASLLLPLRPEDTRLARRRPADIYLPCLEGAPSALDLAVTGPQRTESLPQAAQVAVSAAAAYAALKASHLHTAQTCEGQGIRFVPLVCEMTGAWDKAAGAFCA
jgi:hypothetical protein